MGGIASTEEPAAVCLQISDCKPGDIIYWRIGWEWDGKYPNPMYHYGVYVGMNEAIHFRRKENSETEGFVERIKLEDYLVGKDLYIRQIFPCERKSHNQTWKRAYELLLEENEEWKKYDIYHSNSEHFASYCATDQILIL